MTTPRGIDQILAATAGAVAVQTANHAAAVNAASVAALAAGSDSPAPAEPAETIVAP